ncbi:hypothetical protein DICVIV_05146 [Dictyocaulus viviparus]|uniref:Uncharacterized protein n=1 Tax=Dictyocaulus viviparus TaxID=29172 RepID=A0A0D8XY61_DICVI|nr:hypothetical protein DICVIV_05146 [Dictyocaulus viviparus]
MKLDFELNKKGETVSDVGEEPTETPSKKSEPITPATTDQNHFNNSMISDNNIGMHWCLIAKMGNIQFLLSCIASMSLLATMNIVGFSMFRFTSSAWTTYLMSTAYIAVRAGKWRSYPHLIAYCGMVMFQTVIYMSSLCWIAYSIYGTEFKLQTLHTGSIMSSPIIYIRKIDSNKLILTSSRNVDKIMWPTEITQLHELLCVQFNVDTLVTLLSPEFIT